MTRSAFLIAMDGVLTWSSILIGGAMLAFMTIFGTVNVLVMRKMLNAPIRGAEDLMILSLVILVAIAIPFGGRVGAHIEIEILEAKMSKGFAQWSLFVVRLVCGALMLLMAYELVKAGQNATKFGETTQQLLISYEPFYYLLAVCVAIYALVCASDAVQLAKTGEIEQIQLGDAL